MSEAEELERNEPYRSESYPEAIWARGH